MTESDERATVVLRKVRADIFDVLRRHNVSEQCFAEVATITQAAMTTPTPVATKHRAMSEGLVQFLRGHHVYCTARDGRFEEAADLIEQLERVIHAPPAPAVSCSTCGATDPGANVLCSNGFHAPPAASTEEIVAALVEAAIPLEALLLSNNRQQHSAELWAQIESATQGVRAILSRIQSTTKETCNHNWRSSDSSLYDYKCTKCGETE